MKHSVIFRHFQFYAGQFDGLNQTLTLSGLQKAYKNFQLNLGSGQEPQDFAGIWQPDLKLLCNDWYKFDGDERKRYSKYAFL